MNQIYCGKCCTLLGHFKTEQDAIDTYAGRCPYCKAPLPAVGQACKSHDAALASRQVELDKVK